MSKNQLILFFLVSNVLLIGVSCKSANHSSLTTLQETAIVETPTLELQASQGVSTDKIFFLNVECFRKTNGEDTCIVMNTIEVDGKLKENSNSIHTHGEDVNEYVCSLLSCDGKVLYEEHIDNPLSKHMDTYDESGKIEHKEVNFERNEFSLRVQKNGDYCRLKIIKRKGNSISVICNSTLKK